MLIVSIDALATEKMFARLQESNLSPYDLVIFDESHKLSADRQPDFTVRKTDRYKLAEALAGVRVDDAKWQLSWSTRHLLLLTATPHRVRITLIIAYGVYLSWSCFQPSMRSVLITPMRASGTSSDAPKRRWCAMTRAQYTQNVFRIQ